MKAAINILIQLFWMILCLFLAYLIASAIFNKTILVYLFSALFAVIIYFVIYWIQESIKSTKDPDMQAASNLKMSITRFRLYQRLWNEHQEYMKVHGINSRESEEKFKEIFKQIPNQNEWKRFGQYMEKKQREEMLNEIYNYSK